MALDPLGPAGFRGRMKLPALAFAVQRELQFSSEKLLVACSGGRDSVALLDVLIHISRRTSLRLAVAHLHHGPSGDSAINDYRGRAQEFVRELAMRHGLEFFTAESPTELRNENEMREFRRARLREMSRGFDAVALGHHADDLLETRLIRLIRGTGARGLRAMVARGPGRVVRPFLHLTGDDIAKHARALGWIDDPSNRDSKYLRNWIRNEWLPSLEFKRAGAVKSLGRSLDLLVEAEAPVGGETAAIARDEFHRLGVREKRERLAALSRHQGALDFGSAKIIEVLKRLDRLELIHQREAKFLVGGLVWTVSRAQIEVARHDESVSL